ncbi:MAG: formylglycine-generating enzyme family protein, partial [Planctomycetota bacterium]
LVRVPPGAVTDGADDPDAYEPEKPRRTHFLAQTRWIGRAPVTQRQFHAFCAATGRPEPPKPQWWDDLRGERGDHHVVLITHADALAFCAWAGVALPTEPEWVMAARGTDERKYPWGDDWDPGRRCNFADATCPMDSFLVDGFKGTEWIVKGGGIWDREHVDGWAYTAPVGSFPAGASPCGALDMAGNVWQLCADWFDDGHTHSSRGGGWYNARRDCRTTSRMGRAPEARSDVLGFRVILR